MEKYTNIKLQLPEISSDIKLSDNRYRLIINKFANLTPEQRLDDNKYKEIKDAYPRISKLLQNNTSKRKMGSIRNSIK
jgi:hypothetical protein